MFNLITHILLLLFKIPFQVAVNEATTLDTLVSEKLIKAMTAITLFYFNLTAGCGFMHMCFRNSFMFCSLLNVKYVPLNIFCFILLTLEGSHGEVHLEV